MENNVSGARVPMRILSFSMFPLGLGAVVLGMVDIAQGVRSNRWIEARGTILSSRLVEQRLGPAQPEVRYEFSVNGAPRVSKQIWPGTSVVDFPFVQASAANAVVQQFPQGAPITVWVKPEGDQSALVRGPKRAAIWTAISLFVLLFGGWAPLAVDRWFFKR